MLNTFAHKHGGARGAVDGRRAAEAGHAKVTAYGGGTNSLQ